MKRREFIAGLASAGRVADGGAWAAAGDAGGRSSQRLFAR